MKKILLFICIIVSLTSCEKEVGDSADNYIKLPDAINFFSNEFKNANKIVFINNENETIKMNVDSDYRISPVEFGGKDVYIEKNSISLYYEEFPHYPILLQGTGLFHHNSSNVSPLLLINYMHGGYVDSDYVIVGMLNIHNPELELGSKRFFEEITLNNKVFKNVYSVIKEENDAFSEFYFSQKEGVVGFSDEKDDLWVYDSIIE